MKKLENILNWKNLGIAGAIFYGIFQPQLSYAQEKTDLGDILYGDLKQTIQKVDTDSSGTVTYEEYCEAKGISSDRWPGIWEFIDKSGMTEEDLPYFYNTRLGILTEKQFSDDFLDINKDGVVSVQDDFNENDKIDPEDKALYEASQK